MKIEIKRGSIEEVVAISRQIPEFDNPHGGRGIQKRLAGKKYLMLIAYIDSHAVGFKVGYDKENNGSFYSWMGGVLPAYRQAGVARELSRYRKPGQRRKDLPESGLKPETGIKHMLLFAIKNGFAIMAVEPRETSGRI
jgi:hypothetical protein